MYFSIAPKTFYSVNVTMLVGKFILAVPHPIMLLVSKVYKTVITSPAVRVRTLSGSTRPRIIPCSVALKHSGAIAVLPSATTIYSYKTPSLVQDSLLTSGRRERFQGEFPTKHKDRQRPWQVNPLISAPWFHHSQRPYPP